MRKKISYIDDELRQELIQKKLVNFILFLLSLVCLSLIILVWVLLFTVGVSV